MSDGNEAILGWRIHYADGSVFDSASHDWTDCPEDGVLGVVVYHKPPYRTLVNGGDWYYLDDGMPTCTDTHDDWGAWIDEPGVSNCKRGAAVDDDVWKSVRQTMFDDTEWP